MKESLLPIDDCSKADAGNTTLGDAVFRHRSHGVRLERQEGSGVPAIMVLTIDHRECAVDGDGVDVFRPQFRILIVAVTVCCGLVGVEAGLMSLSDRSDIVAVS